MSESNSSSSLTHKLGGEASQYPYVQSQQQPSEGQNERKKQVKTTMYKNWPAICKVRDPHLRMLAITADEATATCLQRGFPELFVAEKPEHPGPFPLSYLRAAAEKLKFDEFAESAMYGDRDGVDYTEDAWGNIVSGMPDILGEIGLPHERMVHPDQWRNFEGHTMPNEWLETFPTNFVGFTEQETIFPWGLAVVEWNGRPYFIEHWNPVIFFIYPAWLVDVAS
jgi:hypothetical protein